HRSRILLQSEAVSRHRMISERRGLARDWQLSRKVKATLRGSSSHLKLRQPPEPELPRYPTDYKRHADEPSPAPNNPVDGRLAFPTPGRAQRQQRDRRDDIEEAQHETECAAKTADNFRRIVLAEIRVKCAKTGRQRRQCERHRGNNQRQ